MSTNFKESEIAGLIKIINETEDEETILGAMNNLNADSNVLDAAYERAKELSKKASDNNEETLILKNVIWGIVLECYPNSKGNEKVNPELLIKIINETEDEEIILGAMNNLNADSSVLDAAYERAKELFQKARDNKEETSMLEKAICDIAGRYPASNGSDKATPELLIKIINETEDEKTILGTILNPVADSSVLDAAYERAKELSKKASDNKEETSILKNALYLIVGRYPTSKGSDKASPELLTKIIKETEEPKTILGALTKKNRTAEMIYYVFEKNFILGQNNNIITQKMLYIFPYLKYLIGSAEAFELIDYKTVFNSQIAKEVAMLYFIDYPTKFSQVALERFSRECNFPVIIDDLVDMQQLGMNNIRR